MEHPHPGLSRDPNDFWPQDQNPDLKFDLQSDSDFSAFLDSISHSTSIDGHGTDASPQDIASSLTATPEEPVMHRSHAHLSDLVFDQTNGFRGNSVFSTPRDSTIRPGHEESYVLSALNMARALHVSPTVCLFSTGIRPTGAENSGARSIDSVLMANREALRQVSSILQNATSMSSQLQLLLTVICGKVAAWYRAIARNSFEPTASVKLYEPMDNPSQRVKASNEELVERVLHQPIKFGVYSFDSALETKIRAQVVLNELQHVEKLFAHLSRHVASSGLGASTPGAVSSKSRSSFGARPDKGMCPGEAARRRLNEFLCTQLEAVKAEVKAMLTPF
ncbi:hypothetical protein MMC11_004450 [Xylographa trunciseda]|nr:hypothetical protein [Xylographa trunciseda]